MFAIGFTFAYQFLKYVWSKENRPVKELDLALNFTVLGTIIGARLGHCLFYDPAYYLSNPLSILKIWEGGLASHGGFFGVFIGVIFWQRVSSGISVIQFIDRALIPAALVACLIRIGNFFNSEIIGLPSELPWAIIFTSKDNIPRHPAQLYEAFGYFMAFITALVLFFKSGLKEKFGRISGITIMVMTSVRFFVEFCKVNQVSFESGLILNLGQLLSIPYFIIGVMLVRDQHRLLSIPYHLNKGSKTQEKSQQVKKRRKSRKKRSA